MGWRSIAAPMTDDYSSADPESNVTGQTEYRSLTGTIDATVMSAWVSYPALQAALLNALADAAIAWLDHGQMDRDERLLKAARQIKKLRESR